MIRPIIFLLILQQTYCANLKNKPQDVNSKLEPVVFKKVEKPSQKIEDLKITENHNTKFTTETKEPPKLSTETKEPPKATTETKETNDEIILPKKLAASLKKVEKKSASTVVKTEEAVKEKTPVKEPNDKKETSINIKEDVKNATKEVIEKNEEKEAAKDEDDEQDTGFGCK